MDINKITNLPINWIKTELSNIALIIMGQSPPSSTYNIVKKGLPFFQGKTEFREKYPEIKKWCSKPKKIAEKDDILISVRAPVGPTNICPTRSCIGRGLASIRPLDNISTFYVLYLLRYFENHIARQGTGTTFSAITLNQLKNIYIPLPPLNEQKRIVEKIEELFSKLDAGIAALERIRVKIKTYRQAVLKYAFEGKLTEKWRENNKNQLEPAIKILERIKKNYFESQQLSKNNTETFKNKLPCNWSWINIGSISKVIMGQSPPGDSYNTQGKGTPLINGPVEFGTTAFSSTKKVKFTNRPKKLCKTGDLILCVRGSTTGRMNIAGFDACIGRGVAALRAYSDQDYFNYFIHSIEKELLRIGTGSTFPNININQIKTYSIPFPPILEQRQIAKEIERRFENADRVEEVVKKCLKKAEAVRQSILKKAFSGKLVPQDPADEPAEKLLKKIQQR